MQKKRVAQLNAPYMHRVHVNGQEPYETSALIETIRACCGGRTYRMRSHTHRVA